MNDLEQQIQEKIDNGIDSMIANKESAHQENETIKIDSNGDVIVEAKNVYDQVEEDIANESKEEKKKTRDDDAFTNTIDDLMAINNGTAPIRENKELNLDALCIFNILNRIRKDNGEINFSVYNILTPTLKEKVRATAMASGVHGSANLQTFAKVMFSQLYQDSELDSAWGQLQKDIEEANRMPEQMDIFGSVIYNKMIHQGLVKILMAHRTDSKISIENSPITEVVKLTIDCWYLKPLYEGIIQRPNKLRKYSKKYKQNISDIEYYFNKYNIKAANSNKPGDLLKHLSTKNPIPHAHEIFASAIELSFENLNQDNSKEYIPTQTVFLHSLILGILAYINPDKEVQTEEGKILWDSYIRFLKFADQVLNSDIDPKEIAEYKTTIDEISKTYQGELEKAQIKCDENLSIKSEEVTTSSSSAV